MIRKNGDPIDPIPVFNRSLAAISNCASAEKTKFVIWVVIISVAVSSSMIFLNNLVPVVSEAKFLGLPVFVTGDYAVGWIACGNKVSIGFVAFGGVAIGVIAIGGCGIGIISCGGLAIGLLLAFGGGAAGYYSMGGGSLGAFAYAGQGIAIGYYAADGAQKEALLSSDSSSKPKAGE